MFTHPAFSLKIPSASSQRVADFGGHGNRALFEYYGLRCTLERITLSAMKDKTRYAMKLSSLEQVSPET